MKINEFADTTWEEFSSTYLGLLPIDDQDYLKNYKTNIFEGSNKPIPDHIDYRKNGYVTPVKNQKCCRSCWAFSASGAIEGQYFKKYNMSISFSEQNLIDCDKKSSGCKGGLMINAFDYIRENGLCTEESYPYEVDDGKCRDKMCDKKVENIKEIDIIERNNETRLLEALNEYGPISVSIFASDNLKYIGDGIYSKSDCNVGSLNHAVLLIGYGTYEEPGQQKEEYWLLKNSWGTNFGKEGYFRLKKNVNQCQITSKEIYLPYL